MSDVRCERCLSAMTDNPVGLDEEGQLVGGYLRCGGCGFRVEYPADVIERERERLKPSAVSPEPVAVVDPVYGEAADAYIAKLGARINELEAENAALRDKVETQDAEIAALDAELRDHGNPNAPDATGDPFAT